MCTLDCCDQASRGGGTRLIDFDQCGGQRSEEPEEGLLHDRRPRSVNTAELPLGRPHEQLDEVDDVAIRGHEDVAPKAGEGQIPLLQRPWWIGAEADISGRLKASVKP
jgi:hypothetical protein